MATAAAESRPEAERGLIHIEPVRLAAPYLGGWRQVPAPTPGGYWVYHDLNNQTGGVVLMMGSLGSFQQNDLVGWTWAGWKNPYIYAQAGEVLTLQVSTGKVVAQGYGGHTVPRVFLGLYPRSGGAPIEKSVVIGPNQSYTLGLQAPSSDTFTVSVSFNIRSVRRGYAYPYCEIHGTLHPVTHWQRRYLPGVGPQAVGAEELPKGVDRTYRPEAREFDDAELAEQLALFDKEAGLEIPAGPEAFATAEIT